MKKISIFLLKIYKKRISPMFGFFGIHCKYRPTCSEYMMQAIEKYGFLKGFAMGLWRFLRCNPFSKGGYDPVK